MSSEKVSKGEWRSKSKELGEKWDKYFKKKCSYSKFEKHIGDKYISISH